MLGPFGNPGCDGAYPRSEGRGIAPVLPIIRSQEKHILSLNDVALSQQNMIIRITFCACIPTHYHVFVYFSTGSVI